MTTQIHPETRPTASAENAAQHAAAPSPTTSRLLLYLALVPLGLVAYQHLLATGLGLPSLPLTEGGMAMFAALFSLLHSVFTLGWRHTLVFFGFTAVVSWSLEQAGVVTGLVYG